MADAKVQIVVEIDSNGSPVLKRLTGSFEELERGAKRAGSAAVSTGQGFSRLQSNVIASNQALQLFNSTLGRLVDTFVDSFAELQSNAERFVGLSRQFGIPIEQISKLDYVAKRAGSSVEGLAQSMRIFSGVLGKRDEGTTRFFRELGLSLEALRRQAATDLPGALAKTATAIAGIRDQANRTQAASFAFGRSFGEVLKVAQEGDFAELTRQLERLGAVMSDDLANGLERVGDAQGDAHTALLGLTQALTEQFNLVETRQALFEGFTQGLVDARKAYAGLGDEARKSDIPETMRSLGHSIGLLAEKLPAVIEFFADMADEIDRIANLLRTTLGSAALAVLLAPFTGGASIGAVATAGALTGLGIGVVENRFTPTRRQQRTQDLLGFIQGGGGDPLEAALAGGIGRHAGFTSAELAALAGGGGGGNVTVPGGGGGGSDGAEAFAKKLGELQRRVAELRGEITPTQSAVDDIVASFGKGGESVRKYAEELVGLTDRQEAFLGTVEQQLEALKDPSVETIARLQTLAQTVESFEVKGEKMRDALERIAKQERDVTRETIKAGDALAKNLTERLEDLLDPAAKSRREFSELREEAKKLGRVDLLPVVDQIEAVEHAAEVLHGVFGELQRGLGDVFEGLILGTRKTEDAFKGMLVAMVRSISEFLVNAAVKQLTTFALNLVAGSAGGGSAGVGDTVSLGQLLTLGTTAVGGGGGLSSLLGGTTGSFNLGANGGFSGAPFVVGGSGTSIPSTFGLGNIATTGAQAFFSGSGASAAAGFAPGVGEVADIAGTAASASTSFASIVTSVAGLVLALGLAGKSLADSRKSFSSATLGTNQGKNNLLTGVGAGLVSGFTVGGALGGVAVGTVVPGIGNVVGGIVGAAVGAALGSAIHTAVSGAITKGISGGLATRELREGITQKNVDKTVQSELSQNTTLDLISYVLNPINQLVRLIAPGLSLEGLLGAGTTPDVEEIVAKLFRKVLGAGGLNTDKLGNDGSGLSRAQRDLITPEARESARTIGQLVSALVGGGIGGIGDNAGNVDRENRLTNLLTGGAARKASITGQDIEEVIFSAVRRIFGGRLTAAVNLFNGAFPLRSERADELQSGLGRTFRQQFAPLDVDNIIKSMRDVAAEIKNAFGKGPVKQSREAFRDSVGELFAEKDTNQAIANFTRKFASAVTSALQAGLGKVLERTLGDALAPVFAALRRALRQAISDGFDALGPKAQQKIQQSLQTLQAFLTDPRFPEYIAQFVEIQRKFEQTIADTLIKGAAARGDTLEASRLIKEELADATALVRGFRDLATNISGRIARALSQFGENTEAQLAPFRDRAANAKSELFLAAGLEGSAENLDPNSVLGINILNNGKLKDNLPLALELLTQYSEAQLDYLEQQLALSQQLKAVYEGLRQTFKGLVDQVDVFRGARHSQRRLVDRDLEQARELLPKALGGDLDAATTLQQLLPQIFQQATSIYAPGSPALQGILDFVNTSSQQLADKFGKLADAQTEIIKGLRTDFQAFSEFAETVETFQALAQVQLIGQFAEVVKRLGTEGPLYGILHDIAVGLNIPTDTLNPNVAPPTTPTATHDPDDPRLTDPVDRRPPGAGGTIVHSAAIATSAPIASYAPAPGLTAQDEAQKAGVLLARMVAQNDALLTYSTQFVVEQQQARATAERIGHEVIAALAAQPDGGGDTIVHIDTVQGRMTDADTAALVAALATGIRQGKYPLLADTIRQLSRYS
jgi:hypothetical protein